jgi:hypothetical protein
LVKIFVEFNLSKGQSNKTFIEFTQGRADGMATYQPEGQFH